MELQQLKDEQAQDKKDFESKIKIIEQTLQEAQIQNQSYKRKLQRACRIIDKYKQKVKKSEQSTKSKAKQLNQYDSYHPRVQTQVINNGQKNNKASDCNQNQNKERISPFNNVFQLQQDNQEKGQFQNVDGNSYVSRNYVNTLQDIKSALNILIQQVNQNKIQISSKQAFELQQHCKQQNLDFANILLHGMVDKLIRLNSQDQNKCLEQRQLSNERDQNKKQNQTQKGLCVEGSNEAIKIKKPQQLSQNHNQISQQGNNTLANCSQENCQIQQKGAKIYRQNYCMDKDTQTCQNQNKDNLSQFFSRYHPSYDNKCLDQNLNNSNSIDDQQSLLKQHSQSNHQPQPAACYQYSDQGLRCLKPQLNTLNVKEDTSIKHNQYMAKSTQCSPNFQQKTLGNFIQASITPQKQTQQRYLQSINQSKVGSTKYTAKAVQCSPLIQNQQNKFQNKSSHSKGHHTQLSQSKDKQYGCNLLRSKSAQYSNIKQAIQSPTWDTKQISQSQNNKIQNLQQIQIKKEPIDTGKNQTQQQPDIPEIKINKCFEEISNCTPIRIPLKDLHPNFIKALGKHQFTDSQQQNLDGQETILRFDPSIGTRGVFYLEDKFNTLNLKPNFQEEKDQKILRESTEMADLRVKSYNQNQFVQKVPIQKSTSQVFSAQTSSIPSKMLKRQQNIIKLQGLQEKMISLQVHLSNFSTLEKSSSQPVMTQQIDYQGQSYKPIQNEQQQNYSISNPQQSEIKANNGPQTQRKSHCNKDQNQLNLYGKSKQNSSNHENCQVNDGYKQKYISPKDLHILDATSRSIEKLSLQYSAPQSQIYQVKQVDNQILKQPNFIKQSSDRIQHQISGYNSLQQDDRHNDKQYEATKICQKHQGSFAQCKSCQENPSTNCQQVGNHNYHVPQITQSNFNDTIDVEVQSALLQDDTFSEKEYDLSNNQENMPNKINQQVVGCISKQPQNQKQLNIISQWNTQLPSKQLVQFQQRYNHSSVSRDFLGSFHAGQNLKHQQQPFNQFDIQKQKDQIKSTGSIQCSNDVQIEDMNSTCKKSINDTEIKENQNFLNNSSLNSQTYCNQNMEKATSKQLNQQEAVQNQQRNSSAIYNQYNLCSINKSKDTLCSQNQQKSYLPQQENQNSLQRRVVSYNSLIGSKSINIPYQSVRNYVNTSTKENNQTLNSSVNNPNKQMNGSMELNDSNQQSSNKQFKQLQFHGDSNIIQQQGLKAQSCQAIQQQFGKPSEQEELSHDNILEMINNIDEDLIPFKFSKDTSLQTTQYSTPIRKVPYPHQQHESFNYQYQKQQPYNLSQNQQDTQGNQQHTFINLGQLQKVNNLGKEYGNYPTFTEIKQCLRPQYVSIELPEQNTSQSKKFWEIDAQNQQELQSQKDSIKDDWFRNQFSDVDETDDDLVTKFLNQ